jgi:hypothetical protein
VPFFRFTLGAAPAGTLALSAFPRERIAVETRASFRRHLFEAWRADSPQTREQGFMFVEDRDVRPDQAMIFIYDWPQHVSMWMKNTLLPSTCCSSTRLRRHDQAGREARLACADRVARAVLLVVELKAGRSLRRTSRSAIACCGSRAGQQMTSLYRAS